MHEIRRLQSNGTVRGWGGGVLSRQDSPPLPEPKGRAVPAHVYEGGVGPLRADHDRRVPGSMGPHFISCGRESEGPGTGRIRIAGNADRA